MTDKLSTVTRRGVLVGAAGLAAGTIVGPATAAAHHQKPVHRRDPDHHRKHHHGTSPLWEVAWKNGIVYAGSISTWMYADDPDYAALFRREVAMLWPEDDFLWYHLRPSPTSGLDFTYPDMIVEFAEANRQLIIGAPGLVWDEGFGDGWTDDDLWGMSASDAETVLYSTVEAMVHRYRGRVAAWIVCNEVTDPEGDHGLRTDVPWYNTIGPSYVAEAFHRAHQQDPHAMLLINEFGLDTVNQYGDEPVPRQRALLEVIDTLLADRVPLHGLGIEAHLLATDFADRFHRKEFRRFLREVADRGLKILITEMDVLDDGLPAAIGPRDRGVADVYQRFLDTVLEEKAVISVTQYGLSDRWTEENDDNPRDDGVLRRPCPYDDDLQPKPAYTAIRNALARAPHRRPEWAPPRPLGR
ncbi:endo-1,4-beta-xylanase [Microlunatus sp. Gsoil 973]|uniref:endo-1,4-beta-xylanase n=1 Tax=Microlunatus sp. Gsoil 973 TaxID=2672569 RepID=UPI0018A83C30|nr:endo-1,4-beta-xylanase [Microlunatus sp. Gsoil 973]